MNNLVYYIGIVALVIIVLSKLMKPILKASITIIALMIVSAFTIGLIIFLKDFGLDTFVLLMLLVLFTVVEIIGMGVIIVKKIAGLIGRN